MVDMDGNSVKFDLFAFLKKVNDNIELFEDGRVISHIPHKKPVPPEPPKGYEK